MPQSSTTLHEEGLSAEVVDRHRAIVSLMEELEAADWYAQRVEAATNDELRAILQHNGEEEKEHAAMVLEWLRRNDPGFETHLKTYLFTSKPILEIEEEQEAEDDAPSANVAGRSDGSLGIGSLKVKP